MHTPTVNRRGFSPHSLSTDYALLMSFYDIINTLCECIKLRISYSLYLLNAISMQKVCKYQHFCKESILCHKFYHIFDKKSMHKTNIFYSKTNILVLQIRQCFCIYISIDVSFTLHLLTELYEFDKIFLKVGTFYILLCRYLLENTILGKEVNEKWI